MLINLTRHSVIYQFPPTNNSIYIHTYDPNPPHIPQLYTPPTLPTSFPCLSPSKQIFSSGIEFGHTYIHTYIHTSLTHLLIYLQTYLHDIPKSQPQFPIPNPKSQIPNPTRSIDGSRNTDVRFPAQKRVYIHTYILLSLSPAPLSRFKHHTTPPHHTKPEGEKSQPNPT